MQISTDNGATFLPAMTSMTHGLGSDQIYTIYRAPNGTLYVGTSGGLSISTDNGSSFVNRTGADGLDGNDVISVAVGADGAIYAAINWGNLSVSTDGGVTFTTWSQAEGFLSPNGVFSVYSDLNGRTYFGQEYGWLHVRQ